MEALKKSITSEAPPSKGKKPRKAAAGQKEMLLPIEGKKPVAKKAAKPSAQLGAGRRDNLRGAKSVPQRKSLRPEMSVSSCEDWWAYQASNLGRRAEPETRRYGASDVNAIAGAHEIHET